MNTSSIKYVIAALVAVLGVVGLWMSGLFAGGEGQSSANAQGVHETPPAGPINRCVNMGNALEAFYEGEWGYSIRDADLLRVSEAGFDTVRIPVRWSAHADDNAPFAIDETFLARVDHVVQTSMDAGLNVILDVHHYDGIMENPAGQTEKLYSIWRQLSEHYADWPDSLIFEILNEPRDKLTNKEMAVINERVMNIIRQHSPDRWVILSGDNWGSLSGLMKAKLPDLPRTIWSYHYYEPYEFTHQGAPWAYQDMPTGISWGSPKEMRQSAEDMREAAEWGVKHNKPIFMGEFGAYQASPAQDRLAWTAYMRRQAELNGVSWCHWDFASAFPIYSVEDEIWLPGFKDALLGQ